MLSSTSTKLLVILMSIILYGAIVKADNVPSCLTTCLAKTTNPCSTLFLSELITCLNADCPTSAQQAAAAAIHVSYTPKAEYSCQQSVIPHDGGPTTGPLALSGNGTCVPSPFRFKSFVATGASLGLNQGNCEMFVYDGADCEGDGSQVQMLAGQAEGCQFMGGQSARLICEGAGVMMQVARAQLLGICSGKNNVTSAASSGFSPATYGTAPTELLTYLSSNITLSTSAAPVSTSKSASPPTYNTTSRAVATLTGTPAPFKGMGNLDSTADASAAALVAMAAALLVL